MAGFAGDRNIGLWPAKHLDRKAGRLAVDRSFQSPPHRQRIEHDDAAVHLQQALDDALGGEGLAAPLLAENGNVGIERGIG